MLEKFKEFSVNLRVMIILVMVCLVGCIIYLSIDTDSVEREKKEMQENVVADFPDAKDVGVQKEKYDEMSENERSASSARSYWESLKQEDASGGLMPEASEGGRSSGGRTSVALDGSQVVVTKKSGGSGEFSEIELLYIKNGYATEEEIRAKHEEKRRRDGERMSEQEKAARQSDSLYDLILKKYLVESDGKPLPDTAAVEKDKPAEPRRIAVSGNSGVTSTSLGNSGIIRSLEGSYDSSADAGLMENSRLSPAKATFLNSERIVSGQRVIMRLLQDLRLSDNTVIPANTHISGTCTISGRLGIRVSTITYGGKLYYVSLDVYDTDGIEGIYCPVVVNDKAKKARKSVFRDIGNAVSEVVGSVAGTASSRLGNIVNRTGNEIVRSVDEEGNSIVNISSGYEFYVFENLEKLKK